ncbi:ABC transporter substrate-binding protein [Endozoicomonas sp. SM1973]|uniref:ABC transporter substrate-binding protein n=2 Tax=Spartinivicinus marinus TaxID=2994442 RepID=A0A853I7R4_9GAMM|nr:ABC transporter substrate-binding protein [Spartinivicinus marinus]NYZ67742.1 ABC transporter substrate-binding protein [Spartinivicinus marinus]
MHSMCRITAVIVRWLWLLLPLFLLLACKPPQTHLRVGTTVDIGNETLFLARELGYFDQAPIHLVELTSRSQVMNALRSETIEAAILYLDEVIKLLQSELAVKVVLVLSVSHGANALVTRPSIKQIADLKGRRIGSSQSAESIWLLEQALVKAGIDFKEISLIPINQNEHINAYNRHLVDGVVTFEPLLSRLERLGATVQFDSSQMANKIMQVLVVRENVIDRYQQSIEHLLAGYFKAVEYLTYNQRHAINLIAPRMTISTGTIEQLYKKTKIMGLEDNQRLLIGEPPIVRLTVESLQRVMLSHGLSQRILLIDQIIDSRWLGATDDVH